MSEFSNLPIDLLRSFVAVKEYGGVSRAADALARTQPAVSLQIKRLEALLEQRLFHRSRQKFELTDAGEVLLDYAQKILSLNDEVMVHFSAQKIQGRVRLGLPSEFAATLMPRIIGRFSRQYPDVSVEVGSELSVVLQKQFRNKRYDLVLTLQEKPYRKSSNLVKHDDLVWVGKQSSIDFSSGIVPLIVAPQGCMYRGRALKVLKQAKVKNKIVYTIPDLSGIEAAIQEGLGVTVLARNTVPDSLSVIDKTDLPELGEIGISLLLDDKSANTAVRHLSAYLQSNLQ